MTAVVFVPQASGMTLISTTPAWEALRAHQRHMKTQHMRNMFLQDTARFENFSVSFHNGDIFVDYSKNIITVETMKLLQALADQAQLSQCRDRMFNGSAINVTERRAVLHVALRNMDDAASILVDGHDVMPDVRLVREQMRRFCDKVRSGQWLGYTGKPVRTIVNVGIGGSDLGPVMVTEALKAYGHPDLSVRFVSNIDGTHLAETLKLCDPETTLFIIASKTFSTQETLTNAHSARAWFLASAHNVCREFFFGFINV